MTRARVLKMAETLGYKPNLAARYLKSQRQYRFVVNLPEEIRAFFDALRQGIRDAAAPFEPGVTVEFRSHPQLGVGDAELFEAVACKGMPRHYRCARPSRGNETPDPEGRLQEHSRWYAWRLMHLEATA